MGSIKRFIKRLIYGYTCDGQTYIDHLRNLGAQIGNDVNIFHIRKTYIDEVNPHLLSIGNHVNIVGSCILTHDYSWCVIKTMTGRILGNQQFTSIGNNVFIGYGSVVLCGSEIGDNVIIGSQSVVRGKLEANSVYAGVPAKRICSINEYIQKREVKQLDEAKNVVQQYKKVYKRLPTKDVLHEYFYLFTDYSEINVDVFKDKLMLCQNYDESIRYLMNHKPMFDDYDTFLEYCEKCSSE